MPPTPEVPNPTPTTVYDHFIPRLFKLGEFNRLAAPGVVTPEKMQGLKEALKLDEREAVHRGERRFATDSQRLYIWVGERGMCGYCKTDVDPRPYYNMHADHIVPYYYGGRTLVDNLVCACSTCNVARGAMDVLDFFKIIEAKDGLKERDEMYKWNRREFFLRDCLLKYGYEPDEEQLRALGY